MLPGRVTRWKGHVDFLHLLTSIVPDYDDVRMQIYQQMMEADEHHLLVQQHNAKEENILYPMADQALGAAAERLVRRLQQAA